MAENLTPLRYSALPASDYAPMNAFIKPDASGASVSIITRQDNHAQFLCTNTNHSSRTIVVALLPGLSLNLVLKVKVSLIEMMQSHIAVFSAACVRLSVWIHGNVVQRSKMSPHTANLLFENLVVEPRLELSLSC